MCASFRQDAKFCLLASCRGVFAAVWGEGEKTMEAESNVPIEILMAHVARVGAAAPTWATVIRKPSSVPVPSAMNRDASRRRRQRVACAVGAGWQFARRRRRLGRIHLGAQLMALVFAVPAAWAGPLPRPRTPPGGTGATGGFLREKRTLNI